MAMALQDAQGWARAYVTLEAAYALERTTACTFHRGDTVLACVGAYEMEPHRATVWSYLSAQLGRDILSVTRALNRYFEETPYRRLEAQVDVDFVAGHRWIKMLGFKEETPLLSRYRADGGDCVGYVRLK